MKATWLMCGALVFAGARAQAAEPVESPGDGGTTGLWQGTSWGFELRSGVAFRADDDAITPAPIVGLGIRVCTLLTLIDGELFATTEGFSRSHAGAVSAAPAVARYDFRRTSIAVDLRLHPLFIRHLQGGFGDRLAAGVHLAVGLGVDVLSVRGEDRDATAARFAFAVGLGLDVPLTEPNARPWSLWLGLGWRLRFVGFPESAPGLRDMDEHQVLVSFGVRFHDLTGVRLPKPPELDDRDR